MIDSIQWFHSIDLGNGIVTAGQKTYEGLKREADFYFPADRPLAGKSVIDIGAWDGFMSFEAERRGAARVLATDHFCWSGPGWGTKAGFDFARATLGSQVESLDVAVADLDPAKLGTFDIALFPGVLYHLPDPYGGLSSAAAMTHDTLIVETVVAMTEVREPVMRFYLGDELNNDDTNFWAPNEPCLRNMLTRLGFVDIETTVLRHPKINPIDRMIAIARRSV